MSGVGIFILCSLLPNITQLFIALFINNMCSLWLCSCICFSFITMAGHVWLIDVDLYSASLHAIIACSVRHVLNFFFEIIKLFKLNWIVHLHDRFHLEYTVTEDIWNTLNQYIKNSTHHYKTSVKNETNQNNHICCTIQNS